MNHSRRAFTIVELLIAAGVSVVLSGIIYTVGSEALTAFARNISINRSYSDARLALERIANAMQSAGHAPYTVDSTGVYTTASPAAGIRFYRYGAYPTYLIPSGNSAATTLTVSVVTGQTVPAVGDLAVIGQIAFQGTITNVSCSVGAGKVNTGSTAVNATLSFGTTINAGCSPVLTSTQDFTPSNGSPGASPPVAGNSFSCQVYTQMAFIAVPPSGGVSTGPTQLRYYPRAMSASTSGTACGGLSAFNSSTVFNNPANYKVIANLPLNGTNAQICPFQLIATNSPTLTVTLCAEGPDYNNRKLNTANTYTQLQTSLGSRLDTVVRPPF